MSSSPSTAAARAPSPCVRIQVQLRHASPRNRTVATIFSTIDKRPIGTRFTTHSTHYFAPVHATGGYSNAAETLPWRFRFATVTDDDDVTTNDGGISSSRARVDRTHRPPAHRLARGACGVGSRAPRGRFRAEPVRRGGLAGRVRGLGGAADRPVGSGEADRRRQTSLHVS